MSWASVVVDVASPWAGLVRSSADPVTVTFDVDTVYKCDVPANARVQTARESPSCGYPFEAGQRHLVHVRVEPDGTWRTGLCDGNQLLDAAAALPTGGHPPGPAVTYQRWWPWPILAAGLAIGLAIGALIVVGMLVRTRRRRVRPISS